MSLDVDTARHPQPLTQTHCEGEPLLFTMEHLLLLVSVKLGLKSVKAMTRISYLA
jgi:hypothetical protein